MSDEVMQPTTIGDGRFFNILSELAELHSDKARAYGIYEADQQGFIDDPLSNQRFASPDFGVDSWVYALMRANESMRRLQSQVISDNPGNDDIRKSFLDLASHALIALIFYEEDMDMISDALRLEHDDDE
jgi:hypothetical protein